jgi:cytochrome c oxidase cbb3-type subunit III
MSALATKYLGLRTSAPALACAALLLATGCEPWGKPKAEPPEGEQITDFKVLYGKNCAGCHGADGKNGPGRILNSALYLNVLPRETLKSVIENGRAGTAMPAWAKSNGGPFTPQQVDIVVNGIEGWKKPVAFPPTAPPPSYQAGDAVGNPGHGKLLFLKDCFMCHGPGAKIGPVTDKTYLQLVSNQMLRTAVIVGRPDLGMPDYRNLNLGKALSNQDVTDLVSYLASLRPPNSDPALSNDQPVQSPEQPGGIRGHVNENGTGENGATSKGDEGTGNGPGSPNHRENEGNKKPGSNIQGGGK